MNKSDLNQTPALKIRHATVDDARLLAEIGAETFYDAYAPDLPADELSAFVATTFSPQLQAAELADPSTFFLIAEIGPATVGYAKLQEARPSAAPAGAHVLMIPRIYLRQEWIGQGLGSALMKACLAEAARRGHDTICLEVWEDNARARAFYQKWGFEQVGAIAFQFGAKTQTDLVLCRKVSGRPER